MNQNKNIKLTQREIEVLKLIQYGKTNSEIAKEINVSTHTIKANVTQILNKLNVRHRVQAVVKAIRENIIDIWLQILMW